MPNNWVNIEAIASVLSVINGALIAVFVRIFTIVRRVDHRIESKVSKEDFTKYINDHEKKHDLLFEKFGKIFDKINEINKENSIKHEECARSLGRIEGILEKNIK